MYVNAQWGFHVWLAPYVSTPGYPCMTISMRGYPGVPTCWGGGGVPCILHRHLVFESPNLD